MLDNKLIHRGLEITFCKHKGLLPNSTVGKQKFSPPFH